MVVVVVGGVVVLLVISVTSTEPRRDEMKLKHALGLFGQASRRARGIRSSL